MFFERKNPSDLIAKEIGLEIAPWSDLGKVVDMYTSAFSNDPFFDYILSTAKRPERAVRDNFRYDLERARLSGAILRTSSAYEGAAVWHFTGFPKSTFLINMRIARYKLAQFSMFDIQQLLPFFLEIEKAHVRLVKKPHYYLALFGVHPDHQGQGWGSKLMKPVLEHADKNRKICYLETETEQNVKMYEHFGFKLMKSFKPSFSEADFHLMLRKPQPIS